MQVSKYLMFRITTGIVPSIARRFDLKSWFFKVVRFLPLLVRFNLFQNVFAVPTMSITLYVISLLRLISNVGSIHIDCVTIQSAQPSFYLATASISCSDVVEYSEWTLVSWYCPCSFQKKEIFLYINLHSGYKSVNPDETPSRGSYIQDQRCYANAD